VTLDAYQAVLGILRADPRVVAVYAFGSAARGQPDAGDLDVAVLLDRRLDWEAERELRAAVLAAEPRADLVVLNDAPPALRWEVLTGGQCLLGRDPRAQAEFEIVSLSRFLDFQPVRRVQADYLRSRVAERRGSAG
jgi:predicted nucleotidyltransferase